MEEEEEQLLAGMMSPSSGFSSEGEGEEESSASNILALPGGEEQLHSTAERGGGAASTSQRGTGTAAALSPKTRRRRGSREAGRGAGGGQGDGAGARSLGRGDLGSVSLGASPPTLGASPKLGTSPSTPPKSVAPPLRLLDTSQQAGASAGAAAGTLLVAGLSGCQDEVHVGSGFPPPAAVHVLGFPSPGSLHTKPIAAAAGGALDAALHGAAGPVPGAAGAGDEEQSGAPASLGAASRGTGSVGATPTCISLLSTSLRQHEGERGCEAGRRGASGTQDGDDGQAQEEAGCGTQQGDAVASSPSHLAQQQPDSDVQEGAAAAASEIVAACAAQAVAACVARAVAEGREPLAPEHPEGLGFMAGLSVRTQQQKEVPVTISVPTDGCAGSPLVRPHTNGHGVAPSAACANGHASTAAAANALTTTVCARGISDTGSSGRSSMEEDGSTEAEAAPEPATSHLSTASAVAIPLAGTSAPADGYLADAAHREQLGGNALMPPMSARGDAAHGPRVFNPLAPVLSGKAGQARGACGPVLPGLELSLCGAHLRPGRTSFTEANQLFDAHRVGPAEFVRRGAELVASPELMLRLEGVIYPWAAAAPMVLGMAAFNATWPQLVPPSAPFWAAPGAVESLKLRAASNLPSEPSSTSALSTSVSGEGNGDGASKKANGAAATATASTSWRLWPFGGWQGRERSAGGPPPTRTPAATPAGTSPPTGTPMDLVAAARARLPGLSRGSKEGTGEQLPTSPRAPSGPPARSNTGLSTHTSQTTPADESGGTQAQAQGQGEAGREGSRRAKHALSMVRKTLSPSSEQLGKLRLREGQNTIKWVVGERLVLHFLAGRSGCLVHGPTACIA